MLMALHYTFQMTVDICQIRLTIENWPARPAIQLSERS